MLIYGLESTKNNTIEYIGYTQKPLSKRLYEHISESKRKKTYKDKWIQNNISNFYNINIVELDSADNILELKQKEIHYIKLFKSFGAKLKNGTSGGDGVFGYKQTQEQKDLNSRLKSKLVYYFNYKTGELLGSYFGIRKMCEEFKFSNNQVSEILNRKAFTHKGFWFSYNNIFNPPLKEKKSSWNKGISTKNLQKFRTKAISLEKDNIIYNYNSITEASIDLNLNRICIIRALKNNKIYKNYNIKYLI